MYALRLEEFVLSLSGTLALRGDSRGGEAVVLGGVVRVVGVIERPADAVFQEFWSGFRLAMTWVLVEPAEFDTGDVGLEDPD